MTLERLRFAVPGALLLVVAAVFSGCTSMPDPAEPTPPERPDPHSPPAPGPQAAPGEAAGEVHENPAPIVNIHIPDTSVPATLEDYPVQVELRADKDGADEAPAALVLFQQELIERGISLAAPGETGHAYAQVLIQLDLTARKVRDLGAGRTQVEGEGNVAVIRRQGNVTIGRAPLSAMSGANATERVATRQVLDSMCVAAADLVEEKVKEYAARTHRKVLVVDTESPDFGLDAFCDAIEKVIDAEDGLVLVDPRVNPTGKSATFHLWIAPEYEGDLAKLFETKLRESGTGKSFDVEVKVTR